MLPFVGSSNDTWRNLTASCVGGHGLVATGTCEEFAVWLLRGVARGAIKTGENPFQASFWTVPDGALGA